MNSSIVAHTAKYYPPPKFEFRKPSSITYHPKEGKWTAIVNGKLVESNDMWSDEWIASPMPDKPELRGGRFMREDQTNDQDQKFKFPVNTIFICGIILLIIIICIVKNT